MLLYLLPQKGHVAQLNSALDYGSRGCWFESSHGHEGNCRNVVPFFFTVHAPVHANDIFLAFITCLFMLIPSKIITFLYNIGL